MKRNFCKKYRMIQTETIIVLLGGCRSLILLKVYWTYGNAPQAQNPRYTSRDCKS